MKILIVEDDFTSRLNLQELLKSYGDIHIAVNGKEALEAVRLSLEAEEPYELICLDILMPEMDGIEALAAIRRIEMVGGAAKLKPAKIVMTSASADKEHVVNAARQHCNHFLVKPIRKLKLQESLRKMELIG